MCDGGEHVEHHPIDGIKHAGRKSTRTLGLLSGILSYAVSLNLLSENPAHGVERFPDQKNERFLNGSELTALGRALRDARGKGVNHNALDIIELLILTGARRGEIERLRWAEVDLSASQLNLADSKTGQKRIPLNSSSLAVLAARNRQEGEQFVFPGGGGHYVGTPRVWSTLRKKAGLGSVRLHDLRHSFASVGAMGGTPLLVIGALLGHRDHATTQRYAHLAADPVAAAAEDIGQRLSLALTSAADGSE